MADESKAGPIQSEYQKLEPLRQPFLDRARDCSRLTIPYLIPPDGHNSNVVYQTPFQSVGARGVNNLAAKLLIALLPANVPFFRLLPDPKEKAEIEKVDPKLVSKVEEVLGTIERTAMQEIESTPTRPTINQVLRHLIVAGNSLLVYDEKNEIRMFPLTHYVVQRDPAGTVLTIITKEVVSPTTLSAEVKAKVQTNETKEKTLEIYSKIFFNGTAWSFEQEIKGIIVSEANTGWSKDLCPYVPLRWSKIDGEDYGRGYVEDLLGDLVSAEGLRQALVEGAAMSSQVKWLVNPNGLTSAKDLAESENGAFIPGVETDVKVVQMQKYADFQVARSELESIMQSLSLAFLLHSAIRNAERVTAEEVRMFAQELESGLGGVYSVLSQELQVPLVRLLMNRVTKKGKIPPLPKASYSPSIVTGMDAIGRGSDLQKLDDFYRGVVEMVGPQQAPQFVNVEVFLKRRGVALGLDTKDLLKDANTQGAETQQNNQQALAERMAPQVVQQAGQMLQGAVAPTQ
jgi:hypothetical protein